jgi:EAL domain-containing protein (putative c-di-GMP-specific phosphodiesterase class I)
MAAEKSDSASFKYTQRFLSLAFASADLLFEIGLNGDIIFAIGATVGLTERTEAELVGSNWLTIIDLTDHEVLRTLTTRMTVGTRCGPTQVRLALPGADGLPRFALFSACRLPATGDRVSCALTHLRLPLSYQSKPRTRDMDSQVLDAQGFTEAAVDIALATKGAPYPVEIVLVDIHGLTADDPSDGASALIKKIGALLRSASVEGDSVGRLAYNKFGLVHERGDNQLFERIADIRHEGITAGLNLSCVQNSVSVDTGSLTNDDLVKAIKYTINRFVSATPGEAVPSSLADAFETMVGDTMKRMDDFLVNVREQRFQLWFQPIVDMETNRLHHFEVLARFQEGESPFENIRFAEQIGVIEQFDLAVCGRAIAMLESRLATDQAVGIAINISGRSIENSIFVDMLLKILEDHRSLSKWLSLEITESSRMRDLTRAEEIIQKIRQLGFIVCLDDFGAGAASFQYLRSLTIDFVKIDGVYVKQIGQSPRDDAMLRCIAVTCRELGIGTIGEFVETATQARSLLALGVKLAQGWYYGRPTPDAIWVPRGLPVAATLGAENPPAPVPGTAPRKRTQSTWQ